MREGYIKIYRSLFDPTESWLWNEKPFSRGQAWIDLLQMANIKDSRILVKGKVVDVKRGQLFRATKTLADRWGWNRKKVISFLKLLESEKMVTAEGSSAGTLITIEKYAIYNTLGQESDTSEGTNEGQPRDNQGTSNKKDNKDNNNNVHREFKKEFEILWEEYPKKQGKKDALRHYMAARKRGTTFEEVRSGIDRYKKYIQAAGTDMQFVKMGSSFFNQEAWGNEWPIPDHKPNPRSNAPVQIEPPKYREFEPEPEIDAVQMPESMRRTFLGGRS